MSSPGLTSEAQRRYLLQWFLEFSEMQRDDFLPVLAAAYKGTSEHLADAVASLTLQDKPVTLFQCRIKLFNDWFPTWTDEERERYIKELSDIDEDFSDKFLEVSKLLPRMNGDVKDEESENPAGDSLQSHDLVQEIVAAN